MYRLIELEQAGLWKRAWRYATNTGRGLRPPRSLSPGSRGATGTTVEIQHDTRKQTSPTEKAETVKRESDRGHDKRTGIHSMESAGVVSKSVPPPICAFLRWLKIRNLSARSLNNKTCLLINVSIFLTAWRSGFLGCIWILTVVFFMFFALGSSRAAGGGPAADTVPVTAATVTRRGEHWEEGGVEKVDYLCFELWICQRSEIKARRKTGSRLRDFMNCHRSKCFEICGFKSLAAQQTWIKSRQAGFKELGCKKKNWIPLHLTNDILNPDSGRSVLRKTTIPKKIIAQNEYTLQSTEH